MQSNVVEMKKGPAAGTADPDAMTAERLATARLRLRGYKNSSKRTWKEIARDLGYDAGTVSGFMSTSESGPYQANGSSRHIIQAIEQFLELVQERTALITQPHFVRTSISVAMMRLIDKTVLLNRIGVCAGEAGLGKTRVIQEYLQGHQRTLLVRGNPAFSPKTESVWPFLSVLLRKLGGDAAGKRHAQTEAYEFVVQRIRDTARLVIIDEAQFLPPSALNLIRCIYEEANVPVFMAGNETIYERAGGGAGAAAAFEQFSSRSIREWFQARQVKANDVTLIAQQIVGVDVLKEAAPMLLDQARSAGGYRRLINLLQLAQTLRTSPGDPVTRENVLAAIKKETTEEETGGAS